MNVKGRNLVNTLNQVSYVPADFVAVGTDLNFRDPCSFSSASDSFTDCFFTTQISRQFDASSKKGLQATINRPATSAKASGLTNFICRLLSHRSRDQPALGEWSMGCSDFCPKWAAGPTQAAIIRLYLDACSRPIPRVRTYPPRTPSIATSAPSSAPDCSRPSSPKENLRCSPACRQHSPTKYLALIDQHDALPKKVRKDAAASSYLSHVIRWTARRQAGPPRRVGMVWRERVACRRDGHRIQETCRREAAHLSLFFVIAYRCTPGTPRRSGPPRPKRKSLRHALCSSGGGRFA
jgi:hypothetical protein